MNVRLLLCLLLTATLIACRQATIKTPTSSSPVGCDRILDSKLDDALAKQIHGNAAINWIQDNYPRTTVDHASGDDFYWSAADRGYNARFSPNPNNSFVSYGFAKTARPLITDVVTCLGQPSNYWVGQIPGPESSVSRFIMFYPDKGILVEHGSLSDRSQWSVNTLRMDGVVIRKTASIELLAQGIFSAEYAKLVAANIRPWPEKIEDLRFQ